MTQSELAERIGTNKSLISKVETDRTVPKVSSYFRVVSALGLTIEQTSAIE